MKVLYLITYALMYGETLDYGHTFYRYACSEEQVKLLFKKHMGKDFRRVREMRTKVAPVLVKAEGPQQISMWEVVSC